MIRFLHQIETLKISWPQWDSNPRPSVIYSDVLTTVLVKTKWLARMKCALAYVRQKRLWSVTNHPVRNF